MIVKIERADGQTEIFESGSYLISKSKDFHPIICKVTVYAEGKRIKVVKRPFGFIYKHFIFKSKQVQEELKNLAQQAEKKNENAETKVVENEG